MELDGTTVLLTGATGGIGAHLARAFSAAGASLVLTGRRREVLDDLAAELGGAEVMVADLTKRSDVKGLCARAAEVDVLIANAGVGSEPPVAGTTAAQVDTIIDVNLRSVIRLTSAFVQAHLADDRRGHAVLVGSVAGIVATPNSALYNATKFGVRGFALAARQELHGTPVSLSLIEPGFVRDAGMFADSGIALPRGVRTVSPEQVAAATLKAVREDLREVIVAPVEMKLAAKAAAAAPRLSEIIQRRAGVSDRSRREG